MFNEKVKKLQLELEHHFGLSRVFRKKISGLEDLLSFELDNVKKYIEKADKMKEKIRNIDAQFNQIVQKYGLRISLNEIWNFDREKNSVEQMERYLAGLNQILPKEIQPDKTPVVEPAPKIIPEPPVIQNIPVEPVPPVPIVIPPDVTLPQEEEQLASVSLNSEPQNVIPKELAPVESNGKRKILFVDDDPTVTKIFSHFFSKEDFDVFVATNGEEGLEKAREMRPDIILLDIMMPIMNGFEFLEQKKKEKNIVDIPVILVSSFSQDDEILKGLGSGAIDYIVKPFSIPVLVAKVKKVLNIDNDSSVGLQ
ncbi:response regulator transcription factor [Acidobacteriota bacterium]